MNKNIKKNMIFNLIGSTAYAFTSFFFLIIVTRINGISESGVFSFAFSLGCLLICIGNYATRAFQVTEISKEITDYDFIYHRYFTLAIMLLIGLFYSIINQYSVDKLIIIILLIIYKILESYSEVLYGVIQKKEELYKVGISFFLKATLGTLIFLVVDLITKNIVLSLIMLNLITILVIIIYDMNIIKNYRITKSKLDIKKIKIIFRTGLNPFLYTFLTVYIMNASRYVIDIFLSSDYQTIYGILIMPATIMILCSQFLIQPFLTKWKEYYKNNKIKEMKKLIFKLSIIIFIIGTIGIILAWLIGIPFLEIIYNIELSTYKLHLILILIGATLYGIAFLLSAALTTIRKVKVQTIIYLIVSILTFLFTYILINKYYINGAVISYLLSMIILTVAYICVFNYKTKKMMKEVS